jgi:hypothetical protein
MQVGKLTFSHLLSSGADGIPVAVQQAENFFLLPDLIHLGIRDIFCIKINVRRHGCGLRINDEIAERTSISY